jgi:putative hemolysin
MDLKLPLSYLHHYHLAPKRLRTRALDERYVCMDKMAKDTINESQAWRELPPLIRGYLRVGGQIGEGAVIDYDFNTIDVNIIVETANVTQKYLDHYSRDTSYTPPASVYQQPSGSYAA